MAHGTEEQKQRFLPPLLRGEVEGWQCFTEPEAGTDEASMKSTAVRDGDVYVVNGHKIYVGSNNGPEYFFDGTIDNFTIVPEPASMLILGLGSLFALRRRK